MIVFLLWHMRPLGPDETDEEGETDDKLCGVFSTKESAEAARQQLIQLEGFRDYPEDFLVDEYDVDRVQWESGFVSLGPDD
jgi:hypothetical protein